MKEAQYGKQICSGAEAVSAHAHGRDLHGDAADGDSGAASEEIGESAQAMFDRLMEQMKKAEGVTEQLKASDQMEWVGRMYFIRSRAEEIVFSELVYC